VGKTTVAEKAASLAGRQGRTCGGLLAPAMHTACGQKVGIWGVDVASAARRVLARTDRDLGGPRMGHYSFDQAALDWATAVVEEAMGRYDLLLVDEIGKLELGHDVGLAPVIPRLAAGQAPCALVLVREGLLAELQARLGTIRQTVFLVDGENRGELAPHIVRTFFDQSEIPCRKGARSWQT
jgi:nucleoside-triphosphatase THEP1